VAVSSFVVFRALIDVLLTVLQHSIDESGQPMSHSGDGFGSAELAAQAKAANSRQVSGTSDASKTQLRLTGS
jgi:hypothetical protein